MTIDANLAGANKPKLNADQTGKQKDGIRLVSLALFDYLTFNAPVAVLEPAPLPLLLLGLFGIGFRRRACNKSGQRRTDTS
jgi:hypothetical protein